MKAKIKSITIQNFKGCRDKAYDFDGKNTIISGQNASGKTTVLDAFWWLLFNKDSMGNEKFAIRPLDESGNRIDNLEIKVTAVLEVEGKEKEFSKIQKQKWVKRRGSDVTELQGNENLYEIDGYPRSEKDYKTEIADIVGEDIFKMLTNPAYFPSLKWKEQRDILMRFVGEFSDYELAIRNSDFSLIMDELSKAPSTTDILAKYQKMLKEWRGKQSEIPVRIDELEKSKTDIDVAELELGKKAVLELIKSNKEKQENASAQYSEYQKMSDGILQLKFKISDMERVANEENSKLRKGIELKISEGKSLLQKGKYDLSDVEMRISEKKSSIETLTESIDSYREEYKRSHSLVFDKNSLVCSYCGQEYPFDKKEQLKAEFEEKKSKELKRITDMGNKTKEMLDREKEVLAELEKELPKHKESIETLLKSISLLEEELSKIPSSIDISQTDEYKKIEKDILEKEKAMLEMNNSDDLRRALVLEEKELNEKLISFEREIAKASQNVEIDERISELQSEQREVAQKVMSAEGMIYKVEQFIRYKMDCVSEEINKRFEGVNFKLFENQINGGLKETCELTVNGVPYGSLNAGHRIVAGLQIIKALQELYEICMPVFVDNAETVNTFNIPNMDCQMILLKVSDEKEIKLESEE